MCTSRQERLESFLEQRLAPLSIGHGSLHANAELCPVSHLPLIILILQVLQQRGRGLVYASQVAAAVTGMTSAPTFFPIER